MFSVLLVLFVLETHHSASLSGIVVVCSQVPGIIVSPIAGALLDRGSRVALMRFDYLVGSTCITTIGVLSLLHSLPTCVLLLGRVGGIGHGSAQPGRREVPLPGPGAQAAVGPCKCGRLGLERRRDRARPRDSRRRRRAGRSTRGAPAPGHCHACRRAAAHRVRGPRRALRRDRLGALRRPGGDRLRVAQPGTSDARGHDDGLQRLWRHLDRRDSVHRASGAARWVGDGRFAVRDHGRRRVPRGACSPVVSGPRTGRSTCWRSRV